MGVFKVGDRVRVRSRDKWVFSPETSKKPNFQTFIEEWSSTVGKTGEVVDIAPLEGLEEFNIVVQLDDEKGPGFTYGVDHFHPEMLDFT